MADVCAYGPDFDAVACQAAGGTPGVASGEGGGPPVPVRGADGQTWYQDASGWHLYPAGAQDAQKIQTGGGFGAKSGERSFLPGGQSFNIYNEGNVADQGGNFLGFNPTYSSTKSPAGADAVANASLELMAGINVAQNVALLTHAGKTTAELESLMKFGRTGGSGDGVGYANLAQRQAEFQYQQEQDARQAAAQAHQLQIQTSMNALKALADQQAQADARSQQQQSLVMQALPYMTNATQQYFPGFGANDPAVLAGLASPVSIQHTAIPTAQANPYDTQVADQLAQLKQLALQVGGA